MLKVGDYVTRIKYGNDIIFKVKEINKDNVILSGVELRLFADAKKDDLVLVKNHKKKENNLFIRNLNKNDYYYIPGIIVHIDSDGDYIEECEKYYKNNKLKYYSYKFNEKEYPLNIEKIILKHKPNILVITGHDAYYQKVNKYKNSTFFIETVKKARSILPRDKLTIVAGACQSDFKGLISSGATFASSPNHINIHALDPAIIASYVALTDRNQIIDLDEILSKTKYGCDGIGGIITNGEMISIYPRRDV